MKRHFLLLLVAATLVFTIAPLPGSAQSLSPPFAFSYEGYRDVRTAGADTTYMRGLTHRYVGSDLRFLALTHRGVLHEFRLADAPLGGTITRTTATWNLNATGAVTDFNGLWFEQSRDRLWITGTIDYTATNLAAKVTIVKLGASGSVTIEKQFSLDVPAKRVYGSCQAVPASLVRGLGSPYVCGWGGYTSLLNNGGGASIGATMYGIPDPDTVATGSTVAARVILDHQGTRGLRRTIPRNFFDNGQWLSPNADGLGWMVWGDSYYNTGMWLGSNFVSVASLCKGDCWYEDSTLHFTDRQFELHVWDGVSLGSSRTQRPSSMTELRLNRGNDWVSEGNTTVSNIAGATYDPQSGRVYLVGFSMGATGQTGRIFSFVVDGTPPPAVVDLAAPTVTITTPVAGATMGGRVMLTATAADDVGVTGVQFSVDGTPLGAPASIAPYAMVWNTAGATNGLHVLRATASDAAGHERTSTPVTVVVNNEPRDPALRTGPDAIPPVVGVLLPSAGADVRGTVTVLATAADSGGIAGVYFTVDGIAVGASVTSAPYSTTWDTRTVANGPHTLRALARDVAGNAGLSSARVVNVENVPGDAAPAAPASAPSLLSAQARRSSPLERRLGVNWAPDDLNGDGWPDLLLRNDAGAVAAWLLKGTEAGAIAPLSAPQVPPGLRFVGSATFAPGPQLKLLWQEAASGSLSVWTMDGITVAEAQHVRLMPPGWTAIAFADLNADGQSDLLWRNDATGQFLLWLLDDTGRIASSGHVVTPVPLDMAWRLAGTLDVDHDGRADLVWQDTATGALTVWSIRGFTLERSKAVLPVQSDRRWQLWETVDINRDGIADMLWTNTETEEAVVWFLSETSTVRTTMSLGRIPPGWDLAAH